MDMSKRSVRFLEGSNYDANNELSSTTKLDDLGKSLVVNKKHSSIFNNALRPNSALRQLFPSAKDFLNSSPTSTATPNTSKDESDDGIEVEALKKTIEKNIFRRSLTKYEPRFVKQP